MSDSSDETTCPNCLDDEMHRSEEDGWYRYVECIECGFYSTVETGQMSREDIDEARESRDLEPLADDHVIKPLEEGLKYKSYKTRQLEEENERLKKRIGELFKERDELYDKYVNKDTLRFRNKGRVNE